MTQHKQQYYKDGWMTIPFCSLCGKEGEYLSEDCTPLTYDKSEIELKNKLTDLGNRIKKQTLNNPFNLRKRN